MSEFKQIEALKLIGVTAEVVSMGELIRFRTSRGDSIFLTPTDFEDLTPWLSLALGLPDPAAVVAECEMLRARVIELEAMGGAGALTIDAQARKDCEDNAGGWGGDEGERDD